MIKFPDYDGKAPEVTRDNDFKSAFHLFWYEFTGSRGGYGVKTRVSHLFRFFTIEMISITIIAWVLIIFGIMYYELDTITNIKDFFVCFIPLIWTMMTYCSWYFRLLSHQLIHFTINQRLKWLQPKIVLSVHETESFFINCTIPKLKIIVNLHTEIFRQELLHCLWRQKNASVRVQYWVLRHIGSKTENASFTLNVLTKFRKKWQCMLLTKLRNIWNRQRCKQGTLC